MAEPRAQRKLWYVIGGVALLGFAALGATSFMDNLTPYVSFEEAKRSTGSVQVMGALAPGSTVYAEAEQHLRFGLVDETGDTLQVLYDDVKPGNFEEATEIVAIGRYQDDAFHAERLLVKCPSKYQGMDGDVDRHASTS